MWLAISVSVCVAERRHRTREIAWWRAAGVSALRRRPIADVSDVTRRFCTFFGCCRSVERMLHLSFYWNESVWCRWLALWLVCIGFPRSALSVVSCSLALAAANILAANMNATGTASALCLPFLPLASLSSSVSLVVARCFYFQIPSFLLMGAHQPEWQAVWQQRRRRTRSSRHRQPQWHAYNDGVLINDTHTVIKKRSVLGSPSGGYHSNLLPPPQTFLLIALFKNIDLYIYIKIHLSFFQLVTFQIYLLFCLSMFRRSHLAVFSSWCYSY